MTTPIGKYKLVRLIASGGMAEVYLARQAGAAGFEKLVCLKRILPHLARDRQFVEMFLNEARLAARLDHPNIVSIHDLGEANGNYFIAMEFIDGPSLRAVAKRAQERGERLPIAEVVKIVSMAAGGLHYAHDLAGPDGKPLGLVHRDISPDNVLVHRNGMAKVVDFGIAKAANSSGMTRTGTLKGKVAYMPPEQLRGDALDRRADVFALGVVLYEMLGGKRPWEGDSEVSLIGRIMTEDPQPLSVLRPEAPPDSWPYSSARWPKTGRRGTRAATTCRRIWRRCSSPSDRPSRRRGSRISPRRTPSRCSRPTTAPARRCRRSKRK